MESFKILVCVCLVLGCAFAQDQQPAEQNVQNEKSAEVVDPSLESAQSPSQRSKKAIAYPYFGYSGVYPYAAAYPLTTSYHQPAYYPTSYYSSYAYAHDDGKYYPGKYEAPYYAKTYAAYPYYNNYRYYPQYAPYAYHAY